MDPYKSTYQSDYTAPNTNNEQARTKTDMSRVLDKFTYTTTYKQDYCIGHPLPRPSIDPEIMRVDCKPRFIPGAYVKQTTKANVPGGRCACHPGGSMPPRGAIASGLPNNLDTKCKCFSNKKPQIVKTEATREIKTKLREMPCIRRTGKADLSSCLEEYKREKECASIPEENEEAEFRNLGAFCRRQKQKPPPTCPKFTALRPLARGMYGGQRCPRGNPALGEGIPWMRPRRDERREPDVMRIPRLPPRGEAREVIHTPGLQPPRYVPLRRRASVGGMETRIPGPFWTRQRTDERREIDALRRRKFETYSEARDVIHGGGANIRDADRRISLNYPSRRRPATGSATRIPGPFWLRRRPDERREIDALRRRKFDTYYEAREVIHGEGAGGARPADYKPRRHPLDIPAKCRPRTPTRIPGPFWMRQRRDERRDPDLLRRRKFEKDYETRDVIHGEERRTRERLEARERREPMSLNDLPSGPRSLDPFWLNERRDERRDPDFLARRKFGRDRIQAAEIVHGEDFRARWYPSIDPGEGGRRREPVSLDYPGPEHDIRDGPRSLMELPGPSSVDPFWLTEREDERRDPDLQTRRKFGRDRLEAAEIVHGDDFRQQWYPSIDPETREPMSMIDLPTGADPFWLSEREDERRDPDLQTRRKFGRDRLEAAEIVHGDDFRAKWYPSIDPRDDEAGPSGLGPSSMPPMLPRYDDSSDDDAEPYNFRIPYKCSAPRPESGPDPWMLEREYGPRRFNIPADIREAIEDIPGGRVSCAPQSDVSQYDQPNTFMRKLYEKYPYLYQILQETPPEELASKVFKDRFLSTYQVDYLHLGVGEEGSEAQQIKDEVYVGPNGEPESATIPGCSYMRGDKGEFGKQKNEPKKEKREKEKEKEEEKADRQHDEEEERPPESEYMATISRLGEEIVQDQLYRVAEITKNMKNEYKKM